MPEPQQHFSRLCLFVFVDFVDLVTGCIRLSACASEDVSVCLLHASKRTQCLFLAKKATCRLHYTFMIISLCPLVSSFRCGVTSRPFSLPSTVVPPTWWWLCGSPCPSGNISWKNIATWQIFLGEITVHTASVSEVHLFAATKERTGSCWSQQCLVGVCWLNSLLSGSCVRSECRGIAHIQYYPLARRGRAARQQAHISRQVNNPNSFYQVYAQKVMRPVGRY